MEWERENVYVGIKMIVGLVRVILLLLLVVLMSWWRIDLYYDHDD
jgi:CHASE3 domain sensor protein